MKKFLSLMLVAVGLLATSCSKDESTTLPVGGDKVTFTVVAPELATRAIGDGTTATTLKYAVYDQEWNHISNLDGTTTINITAEVELELIDGKTYNLIFWAANADAPYTFDRENKKVTINYNAIKANHEKHDAFYQIVENLTVRAGLQETVELYRPFAQLNIATSDWSAIEYSNEEFTQTEVKVKAYSTLNLVNGEVSDGKVRTFNFEAMPNETLNVNNVNYKWLAMNYLLVNEKELVEVTFNANNANVAEKVWYNVPVERNHRTHILGKLLTSPVDFEIIIMPGFEEPANEYVDDVDALLAAVADATNGDVITVAPGTYPVVLDITGAKNFTLKAAKEGEVIIAGVDHQTNGTPSTVTFEGITFDNSIGATRAAEGWFTGTSPKMDPCVGAWGGDLTFNNCKFIVAGTSKRETGIMTWWTGDNQMYLTFDGCEFVGKDNHAQARAMQIYGKVDMEVTNCTFTTAKDYTLKYVAQEGNVAVFEGNTVSNSENFVELGSSVYPGNNYTVKINHNTLNSVHPYVVANPENQVIIVDDVLVEIVSEDLADTIAAIAALEAGEEFTLVLDENLDVTQAGTENPQVRVNGGDVTIEGNGNGITSGSAAAYGFVAQGENASMTINDTDIVSNGGAIGAVNGAEVVFNSGSAYVDTASTSGRYIFYLEGEGSTITINNGSFSWDPADNQKRAYVYAGAGTFVYINGGTFGKASTRSGFTDGILGTGTVVIKGGTFGFNPSKWVAEGYSAIKKDGNWVVVYGTYAEGTEVENVANAEELANALTAGAAVVNVAAGEYIMPAGNNFTAETVLNCAPGTVFTGQSSLNINGATVVGATFSNPDGSATRNTINGTFKGCTFDGSNASRYNYAGETVVFEDCVFSGDLYGVHFDGGENDVIFRNCTISGFNALGGALTLVTFEGCTFEGNGRSGYNGLNLWGSAKMVDCEFTFDGSTSTEWIDCIGADKTYEFENCTVNGVAYTADNYTEYGDIFSRNNAVVKINGVDCQM